ncbi:MAG: D-aminoacylase, partial [Cyclobacteriaceae bacterium]|nr:D-aminoacylase [Cyclobacteriaceae bacterium]
MRLQTIILIIATVLFIKCSNSQTYDVLIRNGQIIDGSGKPGFTGDIGINADTITAIGKLENDIGLQEIDAKGLVIAPGFINMLSWANVSLIEDGRSQGDIRQGVTLEVMGEGSSMGPLNEALKNEMTENQQDIKYDIEWTTLGEYLEFLERKGISTNV